MINIIKEKLEIDETLKRRLEIICDFCSTTPEIINGSIRKVDKTNLSYIEPHRIFAFNYSNTLYIGNLRNVLYSVIVKNLQKRIFRKNKIFSK